MSRPAAAEGPPAGTWTVAAAGTWAETGMAGPGTAGPGMAPERHNVDDGIFHRSTIHMTGHSNCFFSCVNITFEYIFNTMIKRDIFSQNNQNIRTYLSIICCNAHTVISNTNLEIDDIWLSFTCFP